MRRSEVERVARELFDVAHGIKRDADGNGVGGHALDWECVAEYVLREVRRARGACKGWVAVSTDNSEIQAFDTYRGNVTGIPNTVVARVVVEPKRRRPK